MVYLRIISIFILLTIVFPDSLTAKKRTRPRFSRKNFDITIISKNETSIQAKFPQYPRVKKYYVSVSVKNLADVPSHYWTNLQKKRDRDDDGYYFIDTGNKLEPGTQYELGVYREKTMEQLKTVTVFTDCDSYTYQCDSVYGREMCIGHRELCDGYAQCVDGSDEAQINSSCVIQLPERPTPPPPPTNTNCMMALAAARALEDATGIHTDTMSDCGPDGYFRPMQCDTVGCHCIHPITGVILHTQRDFQPFVHYGFRLKCAKRKDEELKNAPPVPPIMRFKPPNVQN